VEQLKLLEIGLAAIGCIALWAQSAVLLLLVIAGLGVQSALIGPLKYAALPRWVNADALVGVNASMQTVTFVAILVGTAIGSMGVLGWPLGLGLLALVASVLGWWLARSLPDTVLPTGSPTPTLSTMLRAVYGAGSDRPLLHLISGFWAIGSVWLTHLSLLVTEVWTLQAPLIPAVLTLFVLGIGLGSGLGILAQSQTRWTRVITGAVLICLGSGLAASGEATGGLVGVLLTAAGGGYLALPLYVALQRSDGDVVLRIAVLNVINAIAMVVASLASMLVIVGFGVSILGWLAILALLQLLLCLYHRRDLLLCESVR